jgi:tetratricopeptide (TPR) repeat protein
MMKHLPGKFRALGNIGDVLIKMGDVQEAVKMYQRQLSFARQGRDRSLEAAAYGALGLGHRLLRCYDKALGYHTQVSLHHHHQVFHVKPTVMGSPFNIP